MRETTESMQLPHALPFDSIALYRELDDALEFVGGCIVPHSGSPVVLLNYPVNAFNAKTVFCRILFPRQETAFFIWYGRCVAGIYHGDDDNADGIVFGDRQFHILFLR